MVGPCDKPPDAVKDHITGQSAGEAENMEDRGKNGWTTSGIGPGGRTRSSLEMQRTGKLGGCYPGGLSLPIYDHRGHVDK